MKNVYLIVRYVDRVTGFTDYEYTTARELDRTLEMLDDAGCSVNAVFLDQDRLGEEAKP